MIKIKTDEEVLEKANEMRLVIIKSKSNHPGVFETEIRDAETGELIPYISYVEITMDAETERCTGFLHQLIPIKVKEFEHMVDATIVPESDG